MGENESLKKDSASIQDSNSEHSVQAMSTTRKTRLNGAEVLLAGKVSEFWR